MKKIITGIVLLVAACYFIPWKNVNWGNISVNNNQTVTVVGEAKTTVKNEIASFSAGVNATNINKETAVAEVNSKMTALIKSVKDFGINEKDIETQNINVYQNQDYYFENGVQKMRKGAWSVGNTINITLRDISKAQALTDLLAQSSATNVYGPSFRVDDTNSVEKGLYEAVMNDAREKADAIAKAAGRKLGKVVMVNDSGSAIDYRPMMYATKNLGMGGGVAAPVEAGSQTITKNMTVSFELE